MRNSLQIVFGACSFFAVYLIGLVFGLEFRQAGLHFEELFDGKPLPRITEVFVSNPWIANFLLSLPWFVLLGVSFIVPAEGSGFRSPGSFVVRYLAFLSIELFLTFILVQALLMPYLTYYMVMSSSEESWTDLVHAIIPGLAGAMLFVSMVRAWLVRRKTDASRESDT